VGTVKFSRGLYKSPIPYVPCFSYDDKLAKFVVINDGEKRIPGVKRNKGKYAGG
jgi:hypothetical protein